MNLMRLIQTASDFPLYSGSDIQELRQARDQLDMKLLCSVHNLREILDIKRQIKEHLRTLEHLEVDAEALHQQQPCGAHDGDHIREKMLTSFRTTNAIRDPRLSWTESAVIAGSVAAIARAVASAAGASASVPASMATAVTTAEWRDQSTRQRLLRLQRERLDGLLKAKEAEMRQLSTEIRKLFKSVERMAILGRLHGFDKYVEEMQRSIEDDPKLTRPEKAEQNAYLQQELDKYRRLEDVLCEH